MNVGIIIPCYNRPEYLKRCLESVAETIIDSDMNIYLLLINDASTDKTVDDVLSKISMPMVVRIAENDTNKGVKATLLEGIDYLLSKNIDYVTNLDSDAIVRPEWLRTVLTMNLQHRRIVSGFNSLNTNKDGSLRNPILEEHKSYYLKKHCNGINMCFDREQYYSIIRPALQKPGNWDFNSTNKNGFIISKPSVVQHIGLVSSMGHNDNPDVAYDF